MVERRRRGTGLPEIYGMCRPFGPPLRPFADPALTRGAILCRRFAPLLAVCQPLDSLFSPRAADRRIARASAEVGEG